MSLSFNKDESKQRSFDSHWYVINGRKIRRGEIRYSIDQYAEANNKYMKDYDKKRESL